MCRSVHAQSWMQKLNEITCLTRGIFGTNYSVNDVSISMNYYLIRGANTRSSLSREHQGIASRSSASFKLLRTRGCRSHHVPASASSALSCALVFWGRRHPTTPRGHWREAGTFGLYQSSRLELCNPIYTSAWKLNLNKRTKNSQIVLLFPEKLTRLRFPSFNAGHAISFHPSLLLVLSTRCQFFSSTGPVNPLLCAGLRCSTSHGRHHCR